MEIDQSETETARKSELLRNLAAKGPLPISLAKLSGSSRVIPSEKDFHFYNNFQEFKNPVAEIDGKSKTLLEKIGASKDLFGKPIPLPSDKEVELNDDLALDWLVDVNDEIYERFDVSADEFKGLRRKEEESGVRAMRVDYGEGDGFQMVYGKKNKKSLGGSERSVEGGVKGGQEVKVAAKVKPKIPFHVPSIPKPQDEYKIIVNNSNQPFEHVWLQRSEDGSKLFHPLENFSVLDFVDKVDFAEPVRPLPLEVTPFTFVEEVKDLKQLANKLRSVDEFAVDLEHNQYRSFQGLTCLMQISTRTEDFVIDTLKLRIHIGPYLRDSFKDPNKRKVMHGANSDILWLQRDFGIYVCNMFDTGQASRVLKLERFSLEYLLNHFCGVAANKEYQNADWRIRPLPREMTKYAREDTHYLLYIYDLMRTRLLESSADSESSDPPLIEVFKRSFDICTQLYEKELLTDTSYLYIYGVQGADLNAQQLAIVSGLCEWRDIVARAEDESTGYVLPNRTLIDIAEQMPLTTNQLRRVLKSKHSYIERNLSSVVSIIRHSIQNAAAFEEAAKNLKERRMEMENGEHNLVAEESEVLLSEATEILKDGVEVDIVQNSTVFNDSVVENSPASIKHGNESHDIGSSNAKVANDQSAASGHGDSHVDMKLSHSAEVTVQMLKKPSRAFGAFLGNSVKRKFDSDKREKEDAKLEQIKSTVSLPFHTFMGSDEKSQTNVQESDKPSEIPRLATGSTLEEVIVLDNDSDVEESAEGNPDSASHDQSKQLENSGASSGSEAEEGDEPMSLSDLSSSFQECFPSLDHTMKLSKVVDKSQSSDGFLHVEPFDYDAARQQVTFGKEPNRRQMDGDNNRKKGGKKGSLEAKSGMDEDVTDLPQGRRRQAFPASGNRSATFR